MTSSRSDLLVITHDYRSIPIPETLEALRDHAGATIVALNRRQVRWLPWSLRRLQAHRHRKVLLDLPFKHVHGAGSCLSRLDNLYIYEEDACQDGLSRSKWYGQFSDFYRQVAPLRVIATGHITAQRLQRKGVPAVFVPKGYATRNTGLLDLERDIEVGFIGRVRSEVYRERAELLEGAEARLGCRLLRTENDDEYRRTLNRIRFFFSADKGLGEYMAKNFEAMACGCILVAYRQGEGEEQALGLRDGENCLLYQSLDEAAEKLERIRQDPAALRTLQTCSLTLIKQFSHYEMGKRIAAYL
ncbi:glycosyltransferase family protein [Alloalcanivorax xenomutans]|uniref:glycosyltransferase family protein n=1 Tax=Alloalcanivorax xenomutans TaxID=1094342 RepID=UPI001F1ECC09|nr:glycosyltransferase [Alloalcanivorax xenomutans]MCE7523213.1 glycosyltransferase [Alloalcanivorax xenomutans]